MKLIYRKLLRNPLLFKKCFESEEDIKLLKQFVIKIENKICPKCGGKFCGYIYTTNIRGVCCEDRKEAK